MTAVVRKTEDVVSHIMIRRMLVLFLFVVLVFGYLAWRGQVIDHQNQRNTRHQCRVSNINARSLNQFIDALIAATKKVGAGTPFEVDARIQTYEDAKALVQKC
jgi:hypothetical protein